MKYPSFIQPGDRIGFVAPSFGCAFEPYYSAFQNALRQFEKEGFYTKLGPNCYADEGIGISNTPKKCAGEFQEMYQDLSVQMLMSCGGGELMCEILPYIDFNQLAVEKPKWFMGYSDNTNLTFLLTTLADTATIYGPNAGAFGMNPWHASIQDTFELIQGNKLYIENYPKWEKESKKDEDHPLEPYYVTEPFQLIKNTGLENVWLHGRLLGGCLDCLYHLTGTRYDQVKGFAERYADDGIIWFLESCDLNVLEIRRALWNLREAGWFSHVSGFLIGRPGIYGETILGLDQYEAVSGVLKEFNVPVLMDLDIGHVAPMMPLITGSLATVTANGNTVQIQMELR